jgi:malate dehydrogenase
MDISIIGAWGAIGRQTAISLVHNRVLDASSRLQLVGRRGGEAERALVGFASDLQDAYAETIPELDVVFDADDVLGDIIIFAAGATVPTNAKERLPRSLLAKRNLPLFEQYADVIRRHGHGEEIILVVSNPVELGVTVFSKVHPRHRVIGMGGYLDTLRFRREIASELGIRRQAVQGLVLGEHGPHLVPCWSTVSAFGFDSVEGRERIARLRRHEGPDPNRVLHDIQQLMIDAGPTAVFERIATYGPELRTYLKPFAAQLCGAKTTLGTSEMIVRLVDTVLSGNQVLAAAQFCLEGEFLGIQGVTGVPVVLSNSGVLRVEPLELWPEEARDVIAAAEASRAMIVEVGL